MKTIARTLFGLMLLNPVIGSASALSQPENSAPATVPGKEPSKLEGSSTPVRRWLGPDGKPLPFKSDEEIIDFMLNAKVASRKHTPLGVNRPYRVLLERKLFSTKGTVQAWLEKSITEKQRREEIFLRSRSGVSRGPCGIRRGDWKAGVPAHRPVIHR